MSAADDQDLAYERAVAAAQADPAMRDLVERAFLHADPVAALTAFRASEDYARVRRLLSALGVRAGARIVDLGGGRGLLSAALAADGFAPALCEPNPSDVCGTGAARAVRDRTGARFEIAPGLVGELPAASADAVVCRAVLHHVEPLTGVLADARRVLVPGGAFVASDEPTVRRREDVPAAQARHPFVRFGVEEEAHPSAHYVAALRAAGFDRVRSRFPVALADYRAHVRPGLAPPLAAALYARYRLRSVVRPVPGQVRAFTARAPLAD